MAFYSNEEDEDELQPGITPNQSSGSSIVGANSSVLPAKGDSSGAFVGVKNYLDANKTQGAKLGDQAAGIINTTAGDARNKVSGLQNKFNQAADSSVVGFDQDSTNQATQDASKLNDQQKDTVKKQYNAQYSGPQNLTDFSDDYLGAQKAINTASSNVQNQATEGGRVDLVKQINQNAGKNYRTSGALDNLLLQAGGGKEKLASAANQNKDILGSLDAAQTSAQEKAAAAKAQTEATKNQTRAAIGQLDDPNTPEDESSGAFGGIVNYLKGKATEASDPARYQNALSQAQSAQLNDQLLADYGLDPSANWYNLDLESLLSQNPASATWQGVAGADDAAKYNALAEIAGMQGGLQAGNYRPYSIDQGAVGSALRDSEEAYNNYFNLRDDALNNDLSRVRNYFSGISGVPVAGELGQKFSQANNLDKLKEAIQFARNSSFGPQWGAIRGSDSESGQAMAAALNRAMANLDNYTSQEKQNSYLQTQNKKLGQWAPPPVSGGGTTPTIPPIFVPPGKGEAGPRRERRS